MSTTASKSKQSNGVAWDVVGDAGWNEPRHGMMRQIVCRVELVRHGESNANQTLTEHGDASYDPDPELTEWGQEQGEDVAEFYGRMRKEDEPANVQIELSPMRRAIDTSLQTQAAFGNPSTTKTDVGLREMWRKKGMWVTERDVGGHRGPLQWLCPTETPADFRARVADIVKDWKCRGTATKRAHIIAFTHSQFISAVLTHAIPVADPNAEPPQFFHIPNGSITVVDFDTEGAMHVHCVGFTEHLRRPTGQHTAHVETYSKQRRRMRRSPAPEPVPAPTPAASAAAAAPGVYVPPCRRAPAAEPDFIMQIGDIFGPECPCCPRKYHSINECPNFD